MKKLPLSSGHYATVDDQDYERLRHYRRNELRKSPTRRYASTSIKGDAGRRTVTLHRMIIDPPSGFEVDHIDRDGLNCTRSNMRIATRSMNRANTTIPASNTSGFKGVSEIKDRYFKARIKKDGRLRHIGYYRTKEEAASAYDDAARALFGEFARLNFPKAGERPARLEGK